MSVKTPDLRKPRNVLLALGWYDHRLLKGIVNYATEKRWHLAAHSIIHEKEIPQGWDGDGVLAWLAAGDDLAAFVRKLGKPTVDFSLRRPDTPFAHVVQDHAKAGRLVAEHFASRGLRHFAFYGDSDNWSQVGRCDSFVNEVTSMGLKCERLRWKGDRTPADWLRRRRWLAEKMKSAPKPLGVFAANGTLAVEVCELCEEIGLKVPGDVAVVGIDDHLLAVGGTNRSISAVDTNLEEQGYRGAALLDRMMDGEKKPSAPVLIAPAGIHTRLSSDMMAVGHRGIAKALRCIEAGFGSNIGVKEVARAASMSERGLRQAFLKHLGSTPGDLIIKARMEGAKKLLASGDDKVESVAASCGYPNINSFFTAFRREVGMTPTEYRRTHSQLK